MAEIPLGTKRLVLAMEGDKCSLCGNSFRGQMSRLFHKMRADLAASDPKNILLLCAVCEDVVQAYRRRLGSTMAR